MAKKKIYRHIYLAHGDYVLYQNPEKNPKGNYILDPKGKTIYCEDIYVFSKKEKCDPEKGDLWLESFKGIKEIKRVR